MCVSIYMIMIIDKQLNKKKNLKKIVTIQKIFIDKILCLR